MSYEPESDDLFYPAEYRAASNGIPYIPVCRSCGCSGVWQKCEWVGLCPHSTPKDGEFSVAAYMAYCDMIAGKYSTKADCARAHGISIRQFYMYRKTAGYPETRANINERSKRNEGGER